MDVIAFLHGLFNLLLFLNHRHTRSSQKTVIILVYYGRDADESERSR